MDFFLTYFRKFFYFFYETINIKKEKGKRKIEVDGNITKRENDVTHA